MIDACWSHFVDLRRAPAKAYELPEVVQFPALGALLGRLNAPESPIFTTKCDVWPLDEIDKIDPIEFDAPTDSALRGIACYVDLLPRYPDLWPEPENATLWCKRLCAILRSSSFHCCRADLMIRRAFQTPDQTLLGITAYVTACGATVEAAKEHLAAACTVFADSVHTLEPSKTAHSKIQ